MMEVSADDEGGKRSVLNCNKYQKYFPNGSNTKEKPMSEFKSFICTNIKN